MSTVLGFTVSGLDKMVWALLVHATEFPEELREALSYLCVHLEERTAQLPDLKSLDHVMKYGTANKLKILKKDGYTFTLFELGPNSRIKDRKHPNRSEYFVDFRNAGYDYFAKGEVHSLGNTSDIRKCVLSVRIKQI